MALALFLPDWNSLDAVRNAHSLLELWAIRLFATLVACETVAHLIGDKWKRAAKTFERIGLCVFALAVAAELVAYNYGQRNDELSAGVISSLETKATAASTKAATAITDSGAALQTATAANEEAGEAKSRSNAADSAAKEAESHDAETLAKELATEKELAFVKMSRTITSDTFLVSDLRRFRGATYTFLGVYADKDSIDLAKQIDSDLTAAGWTRVPPPVSNPIGFALVEHFWVAASTTSGLLVQVESPNPESLVNTPEPLLPLHVRAAIALKRDLASGVAPPQEDLTQKLGVSPGNHADVFITVGKKP